MGVASRITGRRSCGGSDKERRGEGLLNDRKSSGLTRFRGFCRKRKERFIRHYEMGEDARATRKGVIKGNDLGKFMKLLFLRRVVRKGAICVEETVKEKNKGLPLFET